MRRAAAACAVALLLAAGCGGEETTTWSADGVSFAYPASWKPHDLDGPVFAAQGPAGEGGERLRVGLFRVARKHATAADLERDLRRGRASDIRGARHVDRVEVEGAEAAFRITITARPRELVELLAMTRDEEISLSVGGLESAVDSDAVRAIFDSFRVG